MFEVIFIDALKTSNVSFVFQISLLVGFISVNNSQWTDYSAYSYFQIVTMCDLVMILFFYIIHIFRIYRTLTCVSWPLAVSLSGGLHFLLLLWVDVWITWFIFLCCHMLIGSLSCTNPFAAFVTSVQFKRYCNSKSLS